MTTQPFVLNSPASWARAWRRGWLTVPMNLTNGLVALLGALYVSLVTSALGALPAFGFGMLFLIPALWLAKPLALFERGRLQAFTSTANFELTPVSTDPVWWKRTFLDPAKWAMMAYWVPMSIWGFLTSLVTFTLSLAATLGLVIAALWTRLPDRTQFISFNPHPTNAGEAAVWVVICLLTWIVLPLLSGVMADANVWLARNIMGESEQAQITQLNEQVSTLSQTRTQTVDSVEAERRRIERDLHDGPQQRLVSIAMYLGMAKDAVREDPDAAERFITEAHGSAKEAIAEIRNVARGITPPVLTDQGLPAALRSLAARNAIPVSVNAQVPRLPATTEAIAYFCVSEALANIGKHAQASRASVDADLAQRDGQQWLRVTVRDNGVGGAAITPSGTGLLGLQHRAGAVDGTVDIDSPPGGPTCVTIHLPLPAHQTSPHVQGVHHD